MNKVQLAGRVSQDISIYTTANGGKYAALNIATQKKIKKDDGTYENAAEFIKCNLWNNKAEYVSNYISKGDYVVIEGRLRTTTQFNDRTGKNDYLLNVEVDNIEIGGHPKEKSENTNLYVKDMVNDDELPF